MIIQPSAGIALANFADFVRKTVLGAKNSGFGQHALNVRPLNDSQLKSDAFEPRRQTVPSENEMLAPSAMNDR